MNIQTSDCDHQRIDKFLEADHVAPEDEQLLAHLDNCVACRDYMETQAATPDNWTHAANLLQPSQFDQASCVEYSIATTGFEQVTTTATIQSVLDLLAPSEEPNRLGRLGNYEVSGVIGAGGMGVVLKAIDPALDRVVAIKVLAPHLSTSGTARKRFSREAKAVAAVLHPNVIPIHGVSSDAEIPYLVMAYIRGGSLQKRLNREGPLSTVEILRIGSQVAAGLAAAHEQGLVHRDVKPENILLEQGVERVTLTDFGLARTVDDASVTRTGTIAGTPQYMSPEQTRGEAVDPQSDLFSLGCVLYAVCTGRPPFRAESSYAVMRQISDESPLPIHDLNPEIPEWLCQIISKLMAKKKEDRFPSAAEVHEILEACLNHSQQPTVTQLPKIPRLKRNNRKSSILKIFSGVVVMVALVTACWFTLGVLPIAPPEQQQKQSSPAVGTTPQDAREPAEAKAYQPTPATQQLLDELVKQTKAKKSPWGDSEASKHFFWASELRKAIVEQVAGRLKTMQTVQDQDTAKAVNELQGLAQLFQKAAQSTNASYDAAGQLAAKSWPILLRGYPKEFNAAMVELTKPYAAIRVEDKIAQAGSPTEMLGCDVQAAHAIALARAGKLKEALSENARLRKKNRAPP